MTRSIREVYAHFFDDF